MRPDAARLLHDTGHRTCGAVLWNTNVRMQAFVRAASADDMSQDAHAPCKSELLRAVLAVCQHARAPADASRCVLQHSSVLGLRIAAS